MFFLGPQGDQYWRFDGDVMDEGYPRNISVGFDGVPDGVDAAFAIPAPSHRGQEKAYFFKGTIGIPLKGTQRNDLHVINYLPKHSSWHQEWGIYVSEDRYYQYDFKHQPSHKECVEMSEASPSLLFGRYTDLFCDQTWEDLFTKLFGGPGEAHL